MAIDQKTGKTEEVRFYANAELLAPGNITRQHWDFGDGAEADGASVKHAYTNAAEFAVSLTVDYVLDSDKSNTRQMVEIKRAYITVQNDKGNLSLGRSYRKGYPSEYTWEDIIKAYSQRSVDGNRYIYYEKFEAAYNEGLNTLYLNANNETNRLYVTEAVNEILQGQVMLGNDRLVDALRMKYPRMIDYDPLNPGDLFPTSII